jgi:Type II secretion system (T2SS), protein M
VTSRDRIIIVVILVAAALAGVWFVGLAPKRKEATHLNAQLDVARQQLTEVQQGATKAREAKAKYDSDYAEVASLGKAVPKSDAIPSLVYQLQTAAHDARIVFSSLKVASSGAAPTTPSTPAQTAAAANATSNGNGSGSSSGSNGSSSNGSTANGSTANGSTSSSTPTTPAPATQAATSTLPPGAAVGSAGFPTMPFSFVFNGTFFDMERFLRDVQRFVRVNGDKVDVRGRLLSIDGFALNAGPKGFPSVTATVSATAYLMAPDATTGVTPATSGASAPTGTSAMANGS